MTLPSYLACNNSHNENDAPNAWAFLGLHWTEWLAVLMWAFSFYMENKADMQLVKWKAARRRQIKENKDVGAGVCNIGLWKYSRHPNYFFEFMIWVSYMLFGWRSASTTWDKCTLLMLPPIAYWFLVHFTGVPLTELGSLLHRGETYAQYQRQTNMFFPWFPRLTASTTQSSS